MHGQFHKNVEDKRGGEIRWLFMTKNNFKSEIAFLGCAAQEQELTTNYIKFRIDNVSECDRYRICGQNGGTIWHIGS